MPIAMEAVPSFASLVSASIVTPELQAHIDAAIAALPPAHCRPPTKGEIVESPILNMSGFKIGYLSIGLPQLSS
jgi:hypothetical protein